MLNLFSLGYNAPYIDVSSEYPSRFRVMIPQDTGMIYSLEKFSLLLSADHKCLPCVYLFQFVLLRVFVKQFTARLP